MEHHPGAEASTPNGYSHSLNQCDVLDKKSLEAFRAKRQQWLLWMETDEHHAIWQTVHGLIWSDVSFRAVARIAQSDLDSPIHNPLLTEMLVSGYFATQILGIRRVMDRSSDSISLVKLLQELSKHIDLFTRENFVCFDGLPYDYASVEQRVMLELVPQPRDQVGFFAPMSGSDAWYKSSLAHQQFDRLSGILPENRQRTDRLPIRLIERLESWLKEAVIDELVLWSHVHLAHASGPSSHNRAKLGATAPTLDKISNATRAFARVSEAITASLLWQSGHGKLMATAQFDQFDRLATSDEQRDAIETYWDEVSAVRDAYLNNVETDLISPTSVAS